MKKMIRAALALAVLLTPLTAFGQAHTKELTRAEVDDLLAKPDQVLFIDVRQPDEISKNGGFPVYLNVQIKDLEKSLAWIPKERRIVAVSNHAHRGATAADILAKAGFKVAGAVGAQVYEEQGGKLTKIAPRQPAAKKQ